MSREKLDALRELVGGCGCVVRHGYVAYAWGDQQKSSDAASAVKPVISTLMLIAVQEKKIAGLDEPVGQFEPRLKSLNGGKDAAITWRHLASQSLRVRTGRTSEHGVVDLLKSAGRTDSLLQPHRFPITY